MDRTSQNPVRRRTEKRWFTGLASVGALALVIGCGGGGGGSASGGNQPIAGDNAEVAVAVADAQGAAAGAAVPFAIIQQLEPSLGLFAAGKQPPLFSTRGLVFSDALQLYTSVATSGSVTTFSYFSDAAGKKPAGSIAATAKIVNGFNSYHVVGTISQGPLALTTEFTVAFMDALGANTMSGKLNLTKANIDLTMALSLDDSLNTSPSDSIICVYHATNPLTSASLDVTTDMTVLHGGPKTEITGQAAVSAPVFSANPMSTGTGTATIDLLTGTFSLNITSGDMKGLIAATTGGNGLSVTLGSGLSKLITNPDGFNLGGLAGSGTGASGGSMTSGGTGTTSGLAYAKPVIVTGSGKVRVEQALGDGEMVGYSLSATNIPTAQYWSTASGSPVSLDPPSGSGGAEAHGIMVSGSSKTIVGSYVVNGLNQPCFWTSVGSSFKATAAAPLQSGGEFLAINSNGSTIVGDSNDTVGVQHPICYISGSYYQLLGDGRKGNLRAIGVDNFNDVLGTGDYPSAVPGTWTSIKVGTSNLVSATFSALVNPGISNPNLTAYHISDSGTVIGGTGVQALYWRREDSFGPTALSLGTGLGGLAYGISSDGTKIVGTVNAPGSTLADIGYWSDLGKAPTDLTQLVPANTFSNVAGDFLLNDGSLICLSVNSSNGVATFLYIKKN